MIFTPITLSDQLPLTCSRKGTCCHGNQVLLNPWEIARLANEKKCSIEDFIQEFTELGGIRLRFSGQKNEVGKSACNLYETNFGCSVHTARPLACRLFPLGRQIQHNEVQYMYQGEQFPCLNGCSEVIKLPKLTVESYLIGQETDLFEQAQDEYLEVMQNLADVAFTLLLDTHLPTEVKIETLAEWRKMGNESTDELLIRINDEWRKWLLQPSIHFDATNPISFIRQHNELLQLNAQEKFGAIQNLLEIGLASVQVMASTLYLAKSIGANPSALMELWIDIAIENGAQE